MQRPSNLRFWCAPLCLMLLTGCGGGDYRIVPVSGRVTLNGKPLANVHVSFQPIGQGNPNPGPGSFGVTDAEGRFRLQTVGTRKGGAVVGQHVVQISPYDREDEQSEVSVRPHNTLLPAKASDGSLRFEVPAGGTDKADFPLTS